MSLTRLFPAIAAFFVFGSTCLAQQGGDPGRTRGVQPKKVVLSADPVTGDEAKRVFTKVESALRQAIPGLKPKKKSQLAGRRPVSRAAIVWEMDRLVQMARPAFKTSPKLSQGGGTGVSLRDSAARAKLQELVAWGFVNRGEPLAASSKDTLAVSELGDAIGVLLARIADLTHTPSDRFSPERMR